MMAAVGYRAVGASIVEHLQTEMGSTTYYVTQDISAAMNCMNIPVAILVLFEGFNHMESLGESPCAPTRDARFTVSVIANADSDEAQDTLVDTAVSLIEYHCNCTGHGFPIFGNTEIERSVVQNASKGIDPERGITATVSVETRIKEA